MPAHNPVDAAFIDAALSELPAAPAAGLVGSA
jgi:hypothetical protein